MAKVEVSEGILEGEVVDNIYGGQFYSFKGIPYAEPPVGNFRFKAPRPKKPWLGVRSAQEFGSICYQQNPKLGAARRSEDCLFLNVYTPSLNPTNPLPVMCWIHGGAFMRGSSDSFGPEFLVKHNVTIVTMNYRIGALGFLCLDTEDIPGNAGMKDQVLALRWVKNNIQRFGGDSKNITIFGTSSGGACVSYHLVSPMSRGLFKRAIISSGALTNWWSQTFEPREKALKLAKQLGCNSEDDKKLAEFFRSIEPQKFEELHDLRVIQSAKPYEIPFALVDEKKFGDSERFFYGDVSDILNNEVCEGVEIIAGYTEYECAVAFAISSFQEISSIANNFKEFFVPKQIQLNHTYKTQLEVARKIRKFYFNSDKVNDNNKCQLYKYITMDMFVYDKLLFSQFFSRNNKLYLYKLTCKSERNIIGRMFNISDEKGNQQLPCHGDINGYLFPMKEIFPTPLEKDSDTYTYIERMTTLWTNFAKLGDPTPDASLGVRWLPYSSHNQHYLNIGNTLNTEIAPDEEEFAFWGNIFKEYLPIWSAQ